MPTRLRPLKLGESSDDAVNSILQFSQDGFANAVDIWTVAADRGQAGRKT